MGNIATKAQVKTRLTIAGTGDDTIFDDLIDEVEAEIDERLGRTLLETTHTEYVDGTGTDTLWLRQGPIASVTSVNHVAYEDSGGSRSETLTSVDAPDRLEHGLRSEGWLLPGAIHILGGSFSPGRRNYKVIYVAGFTTTGTGIYPKGLRQAVIDHVAARYLSREATGLASKTLGDGTIDEPMSLEETIKALDRALEPFRSWRTPV